MKFNPPFSMRVPVEIVGYHYEVRGADPKLRVLEINPRRFLVYNDPELGWVAQRRTAALYQEGDSWPH